MEIGKLSPPASVTSGVPQGSCLGPLLFVIYINDLPDILAGSAIQIKMFADDCKIHFSAPEQNPDFEPFENALASVYNWCTKFKLKLALHKCSVLHLGYNNPQRQFSLNNQPLESVSEIRDLGVIIGTNSNHYF